MQRVGVVGSGYMADTHAERYAELPDAEVVAVASTSDGLDAFAAEHDAAAYADFEAMLDDADLTAVDVCTPTPTHEEYVLPAIDRGLAVFCEKPLARTLDAADRIAAAAADADAPVMVGHVLRFFPEYLTAKERIDAGEVGEPGTLRAERLSPPPNHGSWFTDREQSGGVLLDMAIHDFDYLRWVAGDVERVFARRSAWENHALWEHAAVDLRFESGAVGHVEASWAYPEDAPFATTFEFAGDEGSLEFDAREEHAVRFYGESTDATDPAANAYETDPYARELAHFAECAETGAEPDVGVGDAREAVRIALAAIESAKRGAPVRISEVGG